MHNNMKCLPKRSLPNENILAKVSCFISIYYIIFKCFAMQNYFINILWKQNCLWWQQKYSFFVRFFVLPAKSTFIYMILEGFLKIYVTLYCCACRIFFVVIKSHVKESYLAKRSNIQRKWTSATFLDTRWKKIEGNSI